VLELEPESKTRRAVLDLASCAATNGVRRPISTVFPDNLEPRPRGRVNMKGSPTLRASKPHVVDPIDMRCIGGRGDAEADLSVIEGAGVFEGVDVEAQALPIDLPGHEATDHEIPDLPL